MTTKPTVATLAAAANKFLVRDHRRDILLPTDGAPQWFTDLCHHAHGAFQPDDWRYEFIKDALDAFEDGDDPEECEPDVDDLYPYNSDRLDWFASHLDRAGYCDDAMSELSGQFVDTMSLVALGMYWELREVFGLVREFLEKRAEA